MSDPRETLIMSPGKKIDRRGGFRSLVVDEVLASFTANGALVCGRVKNISASGARVLVEVAAPEKPVVLNEWLPLSLTHHHDVTQRVSRVVWCERSKDGWLVGIAFKEKHPGSFGLLPLESVKIDPGIALKLAPTLALRRGVLPFAADERHVYVACQELPDPGTTQMLEKVLSLPPRFEIAEPSVLKRTLERVYGDLQSNPSLQHRSRSVDLRSAGPALADEVVNLCDEILHAAVLRQASDIHIDAEATTLHIRFRVDGMLDTYKRFPFNLHGGIVSRFKVLAGMDIAEKRAPQDGGFKHTYAKGLHSVDLRVATLPTKHGERMTLRLLALQTETLTLEKLGMSKRNLEAFETTLDRPHGMVLLTGPTGSGKSTTLYAAIRRLLAREGLNILTVEDPIEYEIPGVAQTEVDQVDKVSFLSALRSVLRHDPDVVMIGEIRDRETAEVAIKASLTGHLVFSTLHTNSAIAVVTRLVDMGVDRFLIGATLRLAVAQRLVRRLCMRCRQPRPLTKAEAIALAHPEAAGVQVYDPVGCVYCGGRGYISRFGVFEMVPFDDDWAKMVSRGADESQLTDRLMEAKYVRLIDDGFEKVVAGLTSVREVLGAVTAW